MTTATENRIERIRVVWKTDHDADLSHYGEYSDTPGPFYVKTSENRKPGRYQFFNAANVENRQQAHENYKAMRRFESGEWDVLGCYAEAEIVVFATCQTVRSPGLWGVEEPDKEYRSQIALEELAILGHILAELGFTADQINEAREEVSP